MISNFRNFARSKWAAGLLALVALSLLVTGAQMDVFSAFGTKHVITAGDRSVDGPRFRTDFERVRASYQEEAQRPVSFDDLVGAGIHNQYLDAQSKKLGFLAWAWRAGLRPANSLVLNEIRKIPQFFNQITGQFDEEAYRSTLAQQNVTPAMVEQDFRDQYLTRHFGTAMFAGARLPRIYGALIAGQVLESRDGRWFTVTQAMAGTSPAPTEAQLSAYLRENAAELRQPEFRTASVVLFAGGGATAPITDARVQERFDFRKDALSEPEKRTFVTLTAPNRAAADRIAAALRAGQTAAQAGATANVEPATYADTPRTALGDPAVAAAVFGLSAGQVSAPIQGRVGFTVAQVTAVTPGQAATLAGVRDAIIEELRAEDARAQVYDRVEKYERARTAGRTLEVAAAEVGARIQTLVPFTQDGKAPNAQALPYPPQIFTTAYGLSKGGESEVIDAGQGQYFVLRLDDVRAAAVPPLAEIRAPLTARWIAQQNARRLQSKAEELAGQVRAGQDIAAVAARAGATLTTRTSVQADQETVASLGQGLLQGLFGQGRGQVFLQPVSQSAYVIGRVDQVRAPTAALAAPIAEQSRPRTTQEFGNAMIEALAGAGSARAKATYDVDLALQALGVEAPAAATPATPGAPAPAR